MRDVVRMRWLRRRKSERLVLPGPFDRQVGETGHAQAARQPSLDGRLDQIGRKEGKRDRHVHLTNTAPLALGDAFGIGVGICEQLSQPPAAARNRCDQERAARRHYVAWSDLEKTDFAEEYWTTLWNWYAIGGIGHVAAYLATLDLSSFNPKAPPPKTAAFWDIVDSDRAPEGSRAAARSASGRTARRAAPHVSRETWEAFELLRFSLSPDRCRQRAHRRRLAVTTRDTAGWRDAAE